MAVAGRTQTSKSGKAKRSDSEAPPSFFMIGDGGGDHESGGDNGNDIASLFLAPFMAPSPRPRKGRKSKKKLRPRFKTHCFARLLKPK